MPNTTTSVELSVINSMIRTTGAARLSGADKNHPDYQTAKPILDEVLQDVQSMALWYNTSETTLYPNSAGEVLVPNDTLSCDPIDGKQDYVVRDRKLYDLSTGTFTIGAPVKCILTRQIEISDLPPSVLKLVRCKARLDYYAEEDGGDRKMRQYANDLSLAYAQVISENIVKADANFFAGKSLPKLAKYSGYGSTGSSVASRINLTYL